MAFNTKATLTKPPKGRPPSTATISHPVVQDLASPTTLSCFSPNGALFALLILAVDKHRLRVYDTQSSQSTAEHVLDSGRVTALSWAHITVSERLPEAVEDDVEFRSKKRRKKRKSLDTDMESERRAAIEVVVLGISDGSLLFFSPSHGRILRSLSHPSSTSSILSAVVDPRHGTTIWTSSADGVIRMWNASQNSLLGTWKTQDRVPYSDMAIRPKSTNEETKSVEILVANHSIRLISMSTEPDQGPLLVSQKPDELASFTGHASPITRLQWDISQDPPARFLSMAQTDRFVYFWQLPGPNSGMSEGKIVASIPLDSDARYFTFSFKAGSQRPTSLIQTILTISASGKICVFPVPVELTPTNTDKTRHGVPTLLPRSTISVSSKKKSSSIEVIDASFTAEAGRIRIARLINGIRPLFEYVDYLDDTSNFIPDVIVTHDDPVLELHDQVSTGIATKRYAEPPSVTVRTGIELGQDQYMDDLTREDLDVELAELSLGQRLTALSDSDDIYQRATASDSIDEYNPKNLKENIKRRGDLAPTLIPAASLTRTLIQALHSTDTGLLETCLAHSDRTIIRNTVGRLPPQLAIPLLTACMERMGRGARVGTMKGGGAGASSQRGKALLAWVKAVLAIHNGHLMTMPDLVARLSGLHATLTARLALQESLLSLSGRLDMVLSQIEIRSSAAPAPLTQSRRTAVKTKEVRRYREGESDDDDERMDIEPEVEKADEAGSVEDVELGTESGDEAEMTSEEDANSEEEEDEYGSDDSETGGGRLNGFVDDEAEESDDYGEDDDDEDSE